jgi:hypothetical protein
MNLLLRLAKLRRDCLPPDWKRKFASNESVSVLETLQRPRSRYVSDADWWIPARYFTCTVFTETVPSC